MKPFAYAPELLPTHRILQRWAISIGSGLPSDECESRRARVPPLDHGTAIVVDQIHCHQPRRRRELVREWYLGCGSSTVIAVRLGMSRRWVYVLIRDTLYVYREAFAASGYPDLAALLEVREQPYPIAS